MYAIVSTYPPRACGIGTFAADVHAALLGVDEVDRVEKVVVVDEPSRPQRPGLVATIAQFLSDGLANVETRPELVDRRMRQKGRK